MIYKRFTYLIFLSFSVLNAYSQSTVRQQYVATYAQIAVDEMNRSGIPASITLAQGILESGDGQSDLARKSKNHFGIKCHKDWTGERVYHDDDEKDECFRKYKNVRFSFEDHTDFLVRGSRYDFLFDLDLSDYKGWAKGLKKAGYATSPSYADRLIKIIEAAELYAYDDLQVNTLQVSVRNAPDDKGTKVNQRNRVVRGNKKKFVIHRVKHLTGISPFIELKSVESIEAVADSMQMRLAVLLDINDATWETIFQAGDRVYVDYKKPNAQQKWMKVVFGQDMRRISQAYGIKLKKLYKYNNYEVGQQPKVGEQLRLKQWGVFEKRGR
ncbi:MAG TPA: hypothetical protein DHU80_02190 [Cryomorphaceae bacterium]|nr:hypothetical protein [Cryomorphaceae bacterium]HCY25019.1 hypothetical protein [Cryomorphaceae bacterium]